MFNLYMFNKYMSVYYYHVILYIFSLFIIVLPVIANLKKCISNKIMYLCLLQIVSCECTTARVGGARPSTIDAWQCFLLNIRDYIKE